MKRENEIIAADPFVLYDEASGYYYCYSTNDLPNKAFAIHKSKDKVNWTYVDHALDLTNEKIWGRDWFWAPECYYNPNNKHYYLFYSARVKRELTAGYFIDPEYEEDAKIGAVQKELLQYVIELDKQTALNKQASDYQFMIMNNKIDCCCDKANMTAEFNQKINALADASILSYVNSTFIPGTLKLPITSICPQPATATA